MIDINYDKIFEVLDTFTGLPIKRKGRRWYGACYMDGSPSDRWDKITCRLLSDGIQIFEQGMGGITLWGWLLKYGGCSDKRQAAEKLLNISKCNIIVPPPRPKPAMKYVYDSILLREKADIGIKKDNLFSFLASIYGERQVRLAYSSLNITPVDLMHRDDVGTNFWYVNKDNRILHDKIVLYKPIGKRDHAFGGARRFKHDSGFYGKCYFGEHLLKDNKKKVYVVESEKTALIANLSVRTGLFIATGGKNCILHSEPDWVFLSDIDSWEYWESKMPGQCPKWWESYKDWNYGPKDDFGDYLIWLMQNYKR